MVKLQKHKAYTYKADDGTSIEHYKHLVVIPEQTLQQLGWPEGIELSMTTRANSVTIRPVKEGTTDAEE